MGVDHGWGPKFSQNLALRCPDVIKDPAPLNSIPQEQTIAT